MAWSALVVVEKECVRTCRVMSALIRKQKWLSNPAICQVSSRYAPSPEKAGEVANSPCDYVGLHNAVRQAISGQCSRGEAHQCADGITLVLRAGKSKSPKIRLFDQNYAKEKNQSSVAGETPRVPA